MLTEESFKQILDSRLLEFRSDIVASIHKDMLKEANSISDKLNSIKTSITNSNTKIKACEQRIDALEKADSPGMKIKDQLTKLEDEKPVIASLNQQLDGIELLKATRAPRRETVKALSTPSEQQVEEIKDLRNSSIGSPLVFKGQNLAKTLDIS